MLWSWTECCKYCDVTSEHDRCSVCFHCRLFLFTVFHMHAATMNRKPTQRLQPLMHKPTTYPNSLFSHCDPVAGTAVPPPPPLLPASSSPRVQQQQLYHDNNKFATADHRAFTSLASDTWTSGGPRVQQHPRPPDSPRSEGNARHFALLSPTPEGSTDLDLQYTKRLSPWPKCCHIRVNSIGYIRSNSIIIYNFHATLITS